jgi:hypothetical protein
MADKLVPILGALARRAPAIVLAALATHAVVYRSLSPGDGGHSYFSWYTPLAAGLSALSILGLPLVLVIALLGGRESRAVQVAGRLVPRIAPDSSVLREALKLASGSLVFLALQETLEHSLELDRVALPSFAPSSWLVLLVALVTFAAGVAGVGRALSSLVNVIRRAGESARLRPVRCGRPGGLAEILRRSRPLAVHGGLRAPPLGA